jgi:solute carrier family 6 (neurotransmitter transporter, glycine) member 5/9
MPKKTKNSHKKITKEAMEKMDMDMWSVSSWKRRPERDDRFFEFEFLSFLQTEEKFCMGNSQVPLNGNDPERGNWTGRFDFLLSLLGYSVGLGNVWRFPYLCYNNGGGAFLIPFTIMLIIAGLPLMFMELSFGQYASLGPVAIYKRFCPLFSGLGYAMIMVSGIVMLYYNLIIGWTIFYMFASLSKELPWQNCKNEWSTERE